MRKSALIVGGNLAGIQAAMDLADAGLHVHLVETAPFLMNGDDPSLSLDKLDNRPRGMLNTRLLEVARHPNIVVWTKTQLNRVEKRPGGLHVELRRHPRYIDLEKCTACGKCVEVCPVTVPGTNHKAIHLDGQPGCMSIDKTGKPPCANTCPGGIHVQGYVALISQGRFQDAIDLIREAIPFPGICGRVCTHPCEFNCRRAEIDKPVAVRLLKRFVSDWELAEGKRKPAQKLRRTAQKPEKVAVVGAGPGGMAVADRLARLGYRVSVFEKLPVIGGMMAVGIPEYRLPREVIAREYQQIQDLGVEVHLNTPIGPAETTLEDLFEQGYNAVCLAVGAHRSQSLRIPGEELPGVLHGIELLRAINLSQRLDDPEVKAGLKNMLRRGKNTRVAILGGGNTAMDVARSLKRLGLKDVSILYRRTRAEMPAMPEEVDDAEQEGAVIEFLVAPVRVLGDESGVNGLECIRMKLGEPDASGRRRPVPIAGSEFVVDLDVVVLAIGQSPDLSFLGEGHKIAVTRDERINVADVSFQTSRPGVFAVGDAVTSDKMVVIEAIGMGKQAAASIDAYLRGQLPHEIEVNAREAPIARRELSEADRVLIPRTPPAILPVSQRRGSFREVELGYTADQAVAEAQRCLACGPCSECQACVQACQTGAISHDQHETFEELNVGAILYTDDPQCYVLSPLTESQGFFFVPPQNTLIASAVSSKVLARLASECQPLPLAVNAIPKDGQPRIGIFLCQCGEEIASIVNLESVEQKAAALPDVVHTQILPFSCTPEAAATIQAAITAHQLDRAVLAACSCCSINQVCFSCTFQRVRCKQNLGLFTSMDGNVDAPARSARFEFVNVREQCAWAHADNPRAATAKAAVLIAASVAALHLRKETEPPSDLSQPRTALILGHGAAAAVCRKALEKQGVATVLPLKRTVLHRVERSGGQFVAHADGQGSPRALAPRGRGASALVLAPRDTEEDEALLSAFGQENLRPRTNPVWGNVDTHRPGIFHCDPAQDPAQSGAAAAARVSAWLGRTRARPAVAASVDPARCRTCGTCVQICEFGAPALVALDADRFTSRIDPVICTGCGTCVAHCPSGAISAAYASDAELQAMIDMLVSRQARQLS